MNLTLLQNKEFKHQEFMVTLYNKGKKTHAKVLHD